MPKTIWLCAAGLLLALSSNADARSSRAISTDGSVPAPAVIGTPNADVMTMFILSGPGSSDDYVSAGTQRIFCNKNFQISINDTCHASSPGEIVPLNDPADSDGQVTLVLTNFDSSQSYTSGVSAVQDATGVFGGGSGFIYMDMVTDLSDFDFGVLDPTLAATLSALPASDKLQIIGWQDSNVTDGFDPDANPNDPWTYDSLVMAVWFVPRVSAPEPASVLLFAPVLLGATFIAKRVSRRASA
jgi:hypothetical protein